MAEPPAHDAGGSRRDAARSDGTGGVGEEVLGGGVLARAGGARLGGFARAQSDLMDRSTAEDRTERRRDLAAEVERPDRGSVQGVAMALFFTLMYPSAVPAEREDDVNPTAADFNLVW